MEPFMRGIILPFALALSVLPVQAAKKNPIVNLLCGEIVRVRRTADLGTCIHSGTIQNSYDNGSDVIYLLRAHLYKKTKTYHECILTVTKPGRIILHNCEIAR